MKELFYFKHSDLMIQVDPEPFANTYQYSSHRKITFAERELVERYIINNVITKIETNPNNPASLSYTGIDNKLKRELDQFQLNQENQILTTKEKKIDKAVQGLISKSMSNYYFEQIGNTLVEIKKLIGKSSHKNDLKNHRKNLEELVKAYNTYSTRKVLVEKVLPKEISSIGESEYSS